MHDDASVARFWAKVDQNGPVPAATPEIGACWVWTAGRFHDKSGVPTYGMFWHSGRLHYAHRVSCELTLGPIAEGQLALHRCDNPPCVRPSHLYLGSNADNTRDAITRHRLRRRERNHKTKLTEPAVIEIKRRWNEGEIARVLALAFGVSVAAIFRIVTERNWPGVGEPARPHGRRGVPPGERYVRP